MNLTKFGISFFLMAIVAFGPQNLKSQDRLVTMPGYEQYKEISPKIRSSIKSGRRTVNWSDDSKSFTYNEDGKKMMFDIQTKKVSTAGDAESNVRRGRRGGPARGRQYAFADSPDNKWKAYTENRNLWISDADGNGPTQITLDGNEETQLKYGIATWVYGEELGQNTAIWWSPDSRKVAFYRFNEKTSKKYYVLYDQTLIQDSVEIEAYPKVGAENLPVDLIVYDLESKEMKTMDVRNGEPYGDYNVGTYIYGIEWSADGQELLFHRTNRKQDIMEFAAANPNTGATRVVVREEWLASFTINTPNIYWLEDGKKFIWTSERNGYKNFYLYNIDGQLINTVTDHNFEVARIQLVDEKNGLLYYTARSGNNHMLVQLHRTKLNGKGDKRLTDPAFHHNVDLSPDGKYFIDVSQTHDKPPFTRLLDKNGKVVSEIAQSDLTEFNELGLKKVEVFTFISADGKTELHGMLHFPSNFDPNKKYPLLLSNYGGPGTNEFTENFTFPNSLTEFGFLVVDIDGRNAGGRGKHFLDALYGNLGVVEMDDFAEGVKSLYDRPYFDKGRVGVYGTSYGGTTSAACLLRYPDVFHVACANSAVTDWRNYDNIYTERYMNLLENNEAGYEASNLMKYAKDLKGRLMIYYGTSDNNVHPSNSLQLIQALQKARKSFEVQIGPDRGHTALNRDRMMEFFIENLVLNKQMNKS